MSRRVAVFRTERRSERVDIVHSARHHFTVELSGDGQIGRLTEKVLRVIDGTVILFRQRRASRRTGERFRLRLEREKLRDSTVDVLLGRIARLFRLLHRLDHLSLLLCGGFRRGDGFRRRRRRRGETIQKSRHLELFPRAFAIGSGNDRCVRVQEPMLLKELVRGVR